MSGRHGDTERKTKVGKRGGCYICSGSHGYKRCAELKSLGVILRERKEKEEQEKEQGVEMTQLGFVGLWGDIAKHPGIQKNMARSMSTSQLMKNSLVIWSTRVQSPNSWPRQQQKGWGCSPSNAQLKMVNAPSTPVSGVTHGVSFTLGVWQGKTNFTIAHLHPLI